MSVFRTTQINLDHMRDCQREAAIECHAHYANDSSERHVLLQLPTGTGKSALIAALPFYIPCERVLVLVPNLGLVKQMQEDLDIIDHENTNAYCTYKLLTQEQLDNIEFFTMPLTNAVNRNDLTKHHIIVANYHKFQDVEKWFGTNNDIIDLIIIDEAHHQGANTYKEIINFFSTAKIVGLTATPFRSDGKLVEGKRIYTYHFRDAIKKKYIRNIEVNNVTPDEVSIYFTSKNSSEKYTLEQILEMKDEAWFNQEIALSEECCNSIADLAVEKLKELRHKHPETRHEIIASAMTIRHARECIKPAFIRHGLKVEIVSSDKEEAIHNDRVKAELRQGKLDVIISIGMLGEGFNQKTLGVAAIFRPYKSLNPYIQFIGRVLRQNDPATRCHVVSHLGLNQVKRFEEFKMFDAEDKVFLDELFKQSDTAGTSNTFVDESEIDDKLVEKNMEPEVKNVVSQSLDMMEVKDLFVTEDQQVNVISNMFNNLTEAQQTTFLKKLGLNANQINAIKPKRIKPIAKRRAKKSLINERAKSIATDTLKQLHLKHHGRDFNPLSINFAWILRKVNKLMNTQLGINANQRNDVELETFEEFEKSGKFEQIRFDTLEYFKQKLSEK